MSPTVAGCGSFDHRLLALLCRRLHQQDVYSRTSRDRVIAPERADAGATDSSAGRVGRLRRARAMALLIPFASVGGSRRRIDRGAAGMPSLTDDSTRLGDVQIQRAMGDSEGR